MASQTLVYDGYDPRWILGKDKGPPVVPKPKPPPAPAPPAKQAPPPPLPEPEPLVLRVDFCCEGCVERMRFAFKDLDGLECVKVDPTCGEVMITGKVNAEECLQLARRIKKSTELLPPK